MYFKILSDVVIVIHFLWIVFLFIGAYWGTRNKSIRIIHILGLVFAFIIQISNWNCPLTYLELWLKTTHNPSTIYEGSFIIHYLEKIIYIEIPQSLIILFSILLFVFNTWFYYKKC